MMRVGGNQQFREYLEKYNLEDEQAKIKYQTKAAQFYRKRIAALANNTLLQEDDPDYDEGRKMSDGQPLPTRSPQDQANSVDRIEEELKNIDANSQIDQN